MATNKYDAQLLNHTGYNSAIKYYKALKEQFLESVRTSAELELRNKTLDIQSKISNSLYVGAESQYTIGTTTEQMLNNIFADFANNGDIIAAVNKITKSLPQELQQLDMSIKTNREKVKAYLSSDFLKLGGYADIAKKALTEAVVAKVGNTEGLDDLISKSNMLLRIALSAHWQNLEQRVLKGLPLITLQGYLREKSELNALRKVFANTNVKVVHGGGKKAQKVGSMREVETLFDNILSTVEFCEEAFKQQVQGVSAINDAISPTDFTGLLNQITYFGEQVKSFNISNKQALSREHRITSNKALYNQFMTNHRYSNYILIRDSLSFMARYQHILEAFGPATVLFSSGSGRQWTYEFIQDFRKQQYYLSFGAGETPGKWTPDIVLSYPYYIMRRWKEI